MAFGRAGRPEMGILCCRRGKILAEPLNLFPRFSDSAQSIPFEKYYLVTQFDTFLTSRSLGNWCRTLQ